MSSSLNDPEILEKLEKLPYSIAFLYKEIDDCIVTGAFTAAVLLMRKMLMHIAIYLGDSPHQPFSEYIDYMDTKTDVAEKIIPFLQQIRLEANEINHEMKFASKREARTFFLSINALLREYFITRAYRLKKIK